MLYFMMTDDSKNITWCKVVQEISLKCIKKEQKKLQHIVFYKKAQNNNSIDLSNIYLNKSSTVFYEVFTHHSIVLQEQSTLVLN